jgi:hypothetical protein
LVARKYSIIVFFLLLKPLFAIIAPAATQNSARTNDVLVDDAGYQANSCAVDLARFKPRQPSRIIRRRRQRPPVGPGGNKNAMHMAFLAASGRVGCSARKRQHTYET